MIREAEPEDLEEVYELWLELMRYHQSHHVMFAINPRKVELQKDELLSRIRGKRSRILVFEQDGELVGMINVSMRDASEVFKLHRKGYIAETVVQDKYRGSGIGEELFGAAKKWLLDMGADHIEAQVSVQNPGAQRFWQAQGFSPSTQHIILDLREEKRK
ncbi:GNAT family N-acetyltransferase [Pontibacter ruber]|uniref:GNAT family N-acetyltransferase n=1 Tax=Pontibacter ruber TaxID=1343895 RepID=A0ABW5CTL1_9BACT|nr:GNAT family N-acetyltransferase [Pontibacter ruber]